MEYKRGGVEMPVIFIAALIAGAFFASLIYARVTKKARKRREDKNREIIENIRRHIGNDDDTDLKDKYYF
jgi:hypothetical protein